jgi:putative SOS response-associated peptidase YedK
MCYSALVKQDLNDLGRRYGALAVREQIDAYTKASHEDGKSFPPLRDRIYPGHYAPVIFNHDGRRLAEVMRYGSYPPPHIKDPNKYSSFNARRDNLGSSFWGNAFTKHHGVVVLNGFYEWVAVKDLLCAGVVTIMDVETEFQRQSESRKQKIEAEGKLWKPTPTEKKPATDRQIIIEFRPDDGEDLIVPVIFSYMEGQGSSPYLKGFAIITDDPTEDIARAGHDRCPVILNERDMETWLDPKAMTPERFSEFLTQRRRVNFKHQLAKAS